MITIKNYKLVLYVILLFISIITVSSIVSASCCVTSEGDCSDELSVPNEGNCTRIGGTFNDVVPNCDAVDSCVIACCCEQETNQGRLSRQSFCTGVGHIFNVNIRDNNQCEQSCQQKTTVHGFVKTPTDEIITGVQVRAISGQDSTDAVSAVTGEYSLVLTEGTYSINATKEGCTVGGATITINPNVAPSIELNLTLTCTAPAENFTISGFVKNATGIVVGAIVRTDFPGIQDVHSNGTGGFVLSGFTSTANPFNISATKDICGGKLLIPSITIPHLFDKNITIGCTQPCTFTYTAWEPSDAECVPGTWQIREISTRTPEDCNGEPLVEDLLKFCPTEIPPTPMLCGDGYDSTNAELNIIEECDYNQTNLTRNFSTCNPPIPLNCDVNTCKCFFTNPEPPPTSCTIDGLNISLQTTHEWMQPRFNLAWSLLNELDCGANIADFTILRCDRRERGIATCDPTEIIAEHVVSATRNYPDDIADMIPGRTYCYMINATITGFPEARSIVSNISCIVAGDETCIHPPDGYAGKESWCAFQNHPEDGTSRDMIAGCSIENNFTISRTVCEPDYTCKENATSAKCVFQGPCAACNNIFGVFGVQGLVVQPMPQREDDATGDVMLFECPSRSTPQGKFRGYDDATCFADFSRTAVDTATSCSDVLSCYDYQSRGSCESNPCQKFINTSGDNTCNWIYYNHAFNKGVCRPIDIEEQDCSRCDNPLLNRFYPECTADTCRMFGACYFTKNGESKKCNNVLDLSCEAYDTPEDCRGDSLLLVDVHWNRNATGYLIYKDNRTNKLLNSSHDLLAFGRCKWIGTECIKDADNNSINDCDDIKPDTQGDTTRNTPQKICNHDVTPPVTTVTNPGVVAGMLDLRTLQLDARDENYVLASYKTVNPSLAKYRNTTWLYYCLVPNGARPCYPQQILNYTGTRKIINLSDALLVGQNLPMQNDATYTFYYFSEDASKNLEQVKNMTFDVDAVLPTVVILKKYVPVRLGVDANGGDIYVTNVTFIIKLLNETHPPVTCDFSLTPKNPDDVEGWSSWDYAFSVHGRAIAAIGENITTTYAHVPSAEYTYTLFCTDRPGNELLLESVPNPIIIDGDVTISSPTPVHKTFRSFETSSVYASLQTVLNGTCRYSSRPLSYTSMEPINTFTNLGNNVSTAQRPDEYYYTTRLEDDFRQSQIYRYYTACNLTLEDGTSKFVRGDPALDSIYFAVDDIAPTTPLLTIQKDGNDVTPEPYVYNESQTSIQLAFNFNCSDANDNLIDSFGGRTRDLSFGCDQTYYCLENDPDTDTYADNGDLLGDNLVYTAGIDGGITGAGNSGGDGTIIATGVGTGIGIGSDGGGDVITPGNPTQPSGNLSNNGDGAEDGSNLQATTPIFTDREGVIAMIRDANNHTQGFVIKHKVMRSFSAGGTGTNPPIDINSTPIIHTRCENLSNYVIAEDNTFTIDYSGGRNDYRCGARLPCGNSPILYYYSVDSGGNKESIKHVKINIQTMVSAPLIEIIAQ